MTNAEAEAVLLALRVLHKGERPEKGLIWVNSVCATHRFELAYRGRNEVIIVKPVAPRGTLP